MNKMGSLWKSDTKNRSSRIPANVLFFFTFEIIKNSVLKYELKKRYTRIFPRSFNTICSRSGLDKKQHHLNLIFLEKKIVIQL